MSDMREHFNNDGMPADWQPIDKDRRISDLHAEVERLRASLFRTTETNQRLRAALERAEVKLRRVGLTAEADIARAALAGEGGSRG
jgi:hypothetical protein